MLGWGPFYNTNREGGGRLPVHGPLVLNFNNIFKSCSFEAFSTLPPDGEALAKLQTSLDDSLPPEFVEVIGAHRTIIGSGLDGVLDNFDIAPGAQAIKALTEKIVPVGNAPEHLAHVNKIELVGRISPGEGHVVDLKDTIWGHKRGLDGREVDSSDFGTRIFIGHVTALISIFDLEGLKDRSTHMAHMPVPVPISRISFDRQFHPHTESRERKRTHLRILQRSQMEFPIESHVIHVVSDVLLLIGDFIIGTLLSRSTPERNVARENWHAMQQAHAT